MATGNDKKAARAARDRARVYEARQRFHDGVISRRRRDNLIAGVGGGLLLIAIVAGQTAYFTVGAGAPSPSPSPSVSPTPDAPSPSVSAPPPSTPDPAPSTPSATPSATAPGAAR
ncbi:hypothetical protein [Microbacterium sp. No. 7]|uniref:hypothetical protein n=1 Tax=Microbacterium sp. No. 7 TaxID=1714373 RepID=UPI0006D0435E|nr:hypothetical protein [Microbacterium sp. No. 7]